ncbi:hypothetical protein ASPCADRAFT_404885 [Aspergillus carbonarius ITEM 5010]|uniref:Uncharacterized protein n=1 Tax=Aspergillus carbonarius (strain ITEM 5010) TaxID=602072 RepID=A0A1R3RPD2_ASPC5|nr:hypothetical protein ASPCADRAFT_404885 [Aspergillus carbonarius ITEM 5010]
MTSPIPIPFLEQSECTHYAQQAHALTLTLTPNISPSPPILIHPLTTTTGLAIRTLPSNTGKLNRVVGLAISTPLTPHDLSSLEHIYAKIVTELRNPTEEQKEEFIAASVAGYRDGGRKEELLGLLARLATVRGDTGLFVARRVKGGEEEAVVVGGSWGTDSGEVEQV